MRKALPLTALLLLFCIPLIRAAEKKYKLYLCCTVAGNVSVEKFETSQDAEKHKKKMDREYDDVLEHWKQGDKKNPKPEHPLFVKLKEMKESEIGSEAYEKMIEAAKASNKKKIEKIQEGAQSGGAAKDEVGEPKKDDNPQPEKKDVKLSGNAPKPLKARGVPEKAEAVLSNFMMELGDISNTTFKFWAAAEPKDGIEKGKQSEPLVMVIYLYFPFRIDAMHVNDAFYDDLGQRAQVRISRGGSKVVQWGDYYVVKIIPDGKWRQYSFETDWGYLKSKGARIHVSTNNRQYMPHEITFMVADPGVYYIDDVEVGSGGKLPNGDFNSPKDEFLEHWRPSICERPQIKVTKVRGERGQEQPGDQNSGPYFIKLDATEYRAGRNINPPLGGV